VVCSWAFGELTSSAKNGYTVNSAGCARMFHMKLISFMFLLFLAIPLWAQTPLGQAEKLSEPLPSAKAAITPQKDANAQKAANLLQQCIAALGGQAFLSLQDSEQQGRGYTFYHGQPRDVGAPFWRSWKWPDKERVELTKKRDIVFIHNGDNGYEITFRGTAAEQSEPLTDFLRRRHFSLENVLRVWLSQPGTALFYDGTAVAERKPAEVVSIFNAQNEQVTVYIDKITLLPVQKTFTWRDPKEHDRIEETEIYDAYKDVQGVKTPHNLTRKRNGEMLSQRFVDSVRYNLGLADSLFDAKVTWDPYKHSGPRR
jgi:hypothetical protein